ncbi:hypothetical protein KP509_28G063700 [Ceratopteris richardii]|uniref:non-specific serine/threonine protein kinase n=1 Tax=Ceratopteris richardii TaxID=49495 RepID=A0A8T2RD25_CERRI|nr:hypothetical protein KP509_28G063700 [Ceratopteris richardii]
MRLHSPARVTGGFQSSTKVSSDRLLLSAMVSDNDRFAITEKEALLLFKASISKDPRGILTSWSLSGSSFPCNGGWTGVGCDSAGRVVSLDLHSCNLTGYISPSLSNLTFLVHLNLSINSLTGRIPPQLGYLASLTTLDFKRNSLLGTIPQELGPIPRQFGNLTNLTYLYLGSNQLIGRIPAELGNIRKLKELYLMLNKLNGTIPSELGQLRNLEYLSLFMNNFEGNIPSQLGNLTNLKYFWLLLSNLNGTIPPELGKLQNLIQLDLSLNFAISGTIPSELGRLKNLQVLKLFQMNLTGSIPREMGNLSSLQELYVSSNQLSGPIPREIGRLHNLIHLQLYFNRLSGPLPIELNQLQNLQTLLVFTNRLSGFIPPELGAMKSLTSLYLGDNFFTGGLPDTFGNLTNLEYFEVSPNLLRGPVPRSFGKLKSLIYIDISKNKFSGVLPAELANCTTLQWFKASNNTLTGEVRKAFNSFPDLHTVALANNYFTGQLPDGFGNQSSLVVIDLQRNQFHGKLPDVWAHLENLRVLSVGYNSLEGTIPNWLWSLNKLQLIDLGNNRFSGSISNQIRFSDGLKNNVTELDDANNLYKDDITVEMKGSNAYYKYLWTVVISLDLSGNMLSGSVPDDIGALTGLFNLNLSHNALTGSIPTSLAKVLTLESLDLSDNLLTGPIPPQLTQLTSLSFLNLSDNQLSGSIPKGNQFSSFSSRSYLGNKGLCGDPLSVKCAEQIEQSINAHHKREMKIKVAAGCLCATLVAVALTILVYYLMIRRKSNSAESVKIFDKRVKISYKKLLEATNNFSDANVLGSGGSCTVYKGNLDGKMLVAVKRMNNSHSEKQNVFDAEFTVLGQIRHRNLVKMLGTFVSDQLKCLVLEYISNGNLDMHLYKDNLGLSWEQRLHIAIGIASGLSYLHNEAGSGQILHCDLKPSNILLDADFEPHISDFGISKMVNANRDGVTAADVFQGSFGYVAPEYAYGGKLTAKGDVYSFGIVLLELLTRKRPTDDAFEGTSMTLWANSAFQTNWMDMIDPALHDQLSDARVRDEIYNIAILAISCVRRAPDDRPLMKDVLMVLLYVKEGNYSKKSMDDLVLLATSDRYSALFLQGTSSDASCSLSSSQPSTEASMPPC